MGSFHHSWLLIYRLSGYSLSPRVQSRHGASTLRCANYAGLGGIASHRRCRGVRRQDENSFQESSRCAGKTDGRRRMRRYVDGESFGGAAAAPNYVLIGIEINARVSARYCERKTTRSVRTPRRTSRCKIRRVVGVREWPRRQRARDFLTNECKRFSYPFAALLIFETGLQRRTRSTLPRLGGGVGGRVERCNDLRKVDNHGSGIAH